MQHSKIIVFGATGYIGINLVNYLRANGRDVISVSSNDINLLLQESGEQIARLPLNNTDIIITSAITRGKKDDIESYINNTIMLKNIINGLQGKSMRSILYLSAADVYGQPKLGLRENDAAPALNYYGAFKAAAENLLQISFPPGLVSIFRLTGVFGGKGDNTSLISLFSRAITRNKEIRLTNNGETNRGFVSMPLLQEAVKAHIVSPKNDIFNISDDCTLTVKSLVDTISRQLGRFYEADIIAAYSPRDFDLSLNCDKFKKAFPEITFPSLEHSIVQYLRQPMDEIN